jgi:hypothetical protein
VPAPTQSIRQSRLTSEPDLSAAHSPAEAVIPAQQWCDAVFETLLMNRLGVPFKLKDESCIFGRITDGCLVAMEEGKA